jgi:DMSO/TMAO reductase YedYZ molybdopterin-dependent catalytic subunit
MRSLGAIFLSIAVLFAFAAGLAAQSAEATKPELELVVSGDISNPLTLKAADLASMPREPVDVTEQDGEKTTYEGVPLQDILKKAGIPFGR